MTRLAFIPAGGQMLELWRYAPGFESEISRRWGRHVIPGQNGQLLEDVGDGSLSTPVQLVFTKVDDYNTVADALSKSPKGQLVQPRRGTRRAALMRWKESVRWTERGDQVTMVDLLFEDAALSEPSQVQAPGAQAQAVRSQAAAAAQGAAAQKTRIEGRAVDAQNLALRIKAAAAVVAVAAATTAGTAYATAAMAAWSSGAFAPPLLHQLRGLPPLVETASAAMRKTGPAGEVQGAVTALELMLAAATALDLAVRASQPIPIETEISRPGGQSLYGFVQQHYAGRRKTPTELREIGRTILLWNRNLRSIALIPMGTVVIRPSV